ncbi:hypothetical protein NLJ89_g4780 [Agrocybe chaxingu]|uniref:WSC domain-containing protein n=1 Tax=Agrocybe chaxingu TaxID=84603 RepID=A0A9W8K990_9AGAR|nr:hypothetical protein NLJ89_g4780 [Agrocybe chaxingu]
MHPTLVQLLALAVCVSSSVLQQHHSSLVNTATLKHKRDINRFSNRTILYPEDPAELQKRDGTKYVFMHHIVGNTFGYTLADWTEDISRIQAKGVDAIALNIGRSDWQRPQVQMAYDAAASLGTGMKLFYSFDFTEMDCNVDDFVARVNLYANHPNQFKVNGKTMISSFSGDCLGNSGWATLKQRTNGYLMPFIWGLEGRFDQWPSLDSWFCWGCAWPQGNYPKNMDDDNYYISQLGTRYAATVSNWLYTHFTWKNFYLRGDDWLVINRWEQLMSIRDTLTFVEISNWNDWGESNYYGPVKGAQPSGTTWATGYPHTAWYDMIEYYITAFKTGSYPAITVGLLFFSKDAIYFWARPHPAGAAASGDGIGKPTGWDWTEDSMWAAVFATAPATVTLKCGSSSSIFNVVAGVNKLKIPLAAGKMTVQMIRSGQTIINYTPSEYTYTLSPVLYNYNAWVGSATASVTIPTSSSTSASSSATSSSSTSSSATSSSTSSSASATPTGWTSYGCVAEGTTGTRRALTAASYSQLNMTPQVCQNLCSGYKYAGVEHGLQCYCGDTLTNNGATGAIISSSSCSTNCAGDATQKCGGSWTMNVYTYNAGTGSSSSASSTSTTTTSASTTSTSTTTSSTPSATGWTSYGCVAEGTTGSRRALTGNSYSRTDMTPQLCQGLCSDYQYAGVEYGIQCYCGNSLTNNGATGTLISSNSCSNNCGGDASQKCGVAWNSAGCYVDATARMLRGLAVTQSGLTVEKCTDICDKSGYTMAAAEYGSECHCGSTLYKEGGAGVAVAASQCNMPCEGNSAQTCGAGWRANLYLKPGTTIS